MSARNPFPAGVPVLTGFGTVSHVRGTTKALGTGHLVSPSRHHDGYCFMEMPLSSMRRLEGPALPAGLLKERTTRAVVGR